MDSAENCAVLAYRPAAWLKVTGEDSGSYLQGQFSQDLRGLAVGASTYGLLLNHKGRIQADGFIVKAADAFWIASYECPGEKLRERLGSFIVADDVLVEDQTALWSGLAILEQSQNLAPSSALVERVVSAFAKASADRPNALVVGPRSEPSNPLGTTGSTSSGSGSLPGFRAHPGAHAQSHAFSSSPASSPVPGQTQHTLTDHAAAQRNNLFWFKGRRGREDAWECIFPSEVERDLRARLTSARDESPEFWERARIAAAIPSVPRDAGPGDLPQEVGLVAPAVSFTKGCYLGQEIMARLKTRGRVRRWLRQVRFPHAVGPSAPGGRAPPLFAGARLVGELRSWVSDTQGGYIGLAMTPADAPLGTKYSLSPDAEPLIELTVL